MYVELQAHSSFWHQWRWAVRFSRNKYAAPEVTITGGDHINRTEMFETTAAKHSLWILCCMTPTAASHSLWILSCMSPYGELKEKGCGGRGNLLSKKDRGYPPPNPAEPYVTTWQWIHSNLSCIVTSLQETCSVKKTSRLKSHCKKLISMLKSLPK